MQLVEDAPGGRFIGRQQGSSQEQDSPRGGIQFGVYNSLCRNRIRDSDTGSSETELVISQRPDPIIARQRKERPRSNAVAVHRGNGGPWIAIQPAYEPSQGDDHIALVLAGVTGDHLQVEARREKISRAGEDEGGGVTGLDFAQGRLEISCEGKIEGVRRWTVEPHHDYPIELLDMDVLL